MFHVAKHLHTHLIRTFKLKNDEDKGFLKKKLKKENHVCAPCEIVTKRLHIHVVQSKLKNNDNKGFLVFTKKNPLQSLRESRIMCYCVICSVNVQVSFFV